MAQVVICLLKKEKEETKRKRFDLKLSRMISRGGINLSGALFFLLSLCLYEIITVIPVCARIDGTVYVVLHSISCRWEDFRKRTSPRNRLTDTGLV